MAKDDIEDDVNVDGLSPEERAVMEEAAAEAKAQLTVEKAEREEEDALAEEAVKAAKEAEEDEDEEESDDEGEAETGEAAPEAEAAAKEEAKPAAAEVDAEVAAVLSERAPRVVAFSEEDAKALGKIDADRDALFDKFDGGELTRDEYRAQIKALEKTAADLTAKQQRAEESAETYREWDKRQWGASVRAFMAAHPEFTPDVAGEADAARKERSAALDAIVKQQAGVKREGSFSYADLLNEALAIYAMRNPKDEAVLPKAKAEAKRAEEPKKKAAAEKKRPEIPPRLSRLPSAAASDVDDAGFSAIDKLPGDKLEAMLNRMTPEQLEAYERS